ncbi:hypothetical protein A2865_02265 [Candidatus Woesebacteria bacterium RIFCSPHIGHO2_01_FULL_39_17]|uniref:Uncharacterized protein n=3 Tax=Candidatus Woeseibacteriota TaxID=1752722 RepID=A0A0G0QUF7_9BACT|nr:MAG: hypothetical protein US72_C0009G0018 [Microgenomates group bacterium GW2011_GWC1_38_12]KKQ93906.1 MAG: hypothetical protein UT19_C0006G0034 [Candidatus Woesebacteria bacterium GW2011_GWB1_39_10b]KKR13975.1 MAG: hypothetical protein UT40_C0007G0017 [Candidatus Woesebacteria bacterium GW2011_GWA1_39_21b]OGM23467.1 MAG: hypothetical protein A2865_02265 [Candidatus Woesebacteria bacterium RIFCSPHIGHO2_01_FULL_39_17]OGM64256.1 MAG: hypothetical protein A3A52_03090 [Candidatus Woesebacteria b
MAGAERKPLSERVVELSKKADTVLIAVGAGIYVLFNAALGAAIVIGSVLTLIPAQAIERWLKKRRARAA